MLYVYPLQTALLGVIYVLALGRGLQEIGNKVNMMEYHSMYDHEDPVAMSTYRLLFAGSILASLFWVSTFQKAMCFSSTLLGICLYSQAVVQAMWLWYATGLETEEELAKDRKVPKSVPSKMYQ